MKLMTPIVMLALAFATAAFARDIPVANAAEIAAAAARAAPGDTLVMADGEWRDQVIIFEGEGREQAPLRLAARTPGRVVLSGRSRLQIGGRWLEVSGLSFKNGSLRKGEAVVAFRTRKTEAFDSRFTNSAIVAYNPPDPATRYFWVTLYGQRNRVDHNLFSGQNHSGVTVVVVRGKPVRDEHRIDHNRFTDRPRGTGNGYETIRIGSSADADTVSGTIVESNLFERTNGEIEVVSVKSGGNQIRNNTFVEVQGSVTLRDGSGSRVAGNVFLGNGVPGTGGIRVMGAGHVVADNHLQDISAATGGAIALNCGNAEAYAGNSAPVADVRIERNTVINPQGAAINATRGCGTLGRTVLPRRLVIEGNRVFGDLPELVQGDATQEWRVERNLLARPPDRAVRKLSSGVIELLPAGSEPALPAAGPVTAAETGPDWARAGR